VAEGARLESVFRLIPNEGSNPSLSAKYNTKPRTKVWGFVVFATSLDVSIEARGSWGEVCTSNTVLCNLLEF
jgi:hypothetical protein